ncbi:putative retroelement [Phytophthora palmivora]|uniref:Retroelement n=1 Tax=Phytophthora palmivora TaxID=4796 RepID=A0A2P4X2G3_9STRA|nr:putative retroelement [Phytophthora palmivora]
MLNSLDPCRSPKEGCRLGMGAIAPGCFGSIKASLHHALVLVLADENYTPMDAKVDRLSPRQRAQLHRYELADRLLHCRADPGYPPRVVVPNDEDLKYNILLEAHGAPMIGHLGRGNAYQAASQTFWWPRMYKWVAHYVKTCETRQRVKPSGHASAPPQSLSSISLDFVFGLPTDDKGNAGILVFVCRLSKMVHLAPVRDKVTGKQAAQLFLDSVFRYHGLPEIIVSDRDPRFTGRSGTPCSSYGELS